MRGRTLAEVCAAAVLAGSAEREAAGSRLQRLGLCARPQTAEKFWASPPRQLAPPSPSAVSNPLSLTFPRGPPAEALLGRPLELQAESGSVGHLRQQAQAG